MTQDAKNLGRMEKGIENLERTCASLDINLRENTRQTIELTTTMKGMAEVFGKHIDDYAEFSTDTDHRLKSLEGTRNKAIGYAAGAGGVTGGLLALLLRIFGHN